jgi:hypothetical protein
VKRIACAYDGCAQRRAHHERPDEARGVQYVEVPDDHPADREAFCSLTCAMLAGRLSVRAPAEAKGGAVLERNGVIVYLAEIANRCDLPYKPLIEDLKLLSDESLNTLLGMFFRCTEQTLRAAEELGQKNVAARGAHGKGQGES